MAKPYSMDLRERVVTAIDCGGLSCRQAAKRFGVAASTAIGWVKRVRSTGSAAPGQMGGWRRGKIAGEHRDWLVERCKSGNFTLRGLVLELAGRGLKVDYRTMWAFVRAENLSYKKRMARPVASSFVDPDRASLRQRIRPIGHCRGQDGDPRVPGPHKNLGVTLRHFLKQVSETPVRLLGHLAFHHPQTSAASSRGVLCGSGLDQTHALALLSAAP
jgi:transposase